MRLKLFLIVLLAAVLPGLAQSSKIVGTVVNASTGAPISGATVSLSKQGNATTDANGNFGTVAGFAVAQLERLCSWL